MEITNIKVTKVARGNILGYANITIDNAIAINNIRIVKAPNGRFIAMPSTRSSKKDKDGKARYYDIVFPVNTETRSRLTTEILKAYDALPTPEPEAKDVPETDNTEAFGI